MYEFDYTSPTSLDDAASRLSDADAKLVAGGMTLVPTLKLRLAKPSDLGCPSPFARESPRSTALAIRLAR